jgi:hypothetical protein
LTVRRVTPLSFGARRSRFAAFPGAGRSAAALSGTPIRRSRKGRAGPAVAPRPRRACWNFTRSLAICCSWLPSDVAVFAVVCDATGQWFALSPAVRELSGRHGIRRVGALPNPNGAPHRKPQHPYGPRRRPASSVERVRQIDVRRNSAPILIG